MIEAEDKRQKSEENKVKEDENIKEVLNKSMESSDSLDNFRLRISDDESNKNGGSPNKEGSADSDVEKMEVDISLSDKYEGCADEKDAASRPDSATGDEDMKEEAPLTNGMSTGDEVDDETSVMLPDGSSVQTKEESTAEEMLADANEECFVNNVSEQAPENDTSEVNIDEKNSPETKSENSPEPRSENDPPKPKSENPTEPKVENPSGTKSENPSEIKPENPAELKPENPAELKSENPAEPELENPSSNAAIEKSAEIENPLQDVSSNDSSSFRSIENDGKVKITSEAKKRQAEDDGSDDGSSNDSESKKARLNKKLCSEKDCEKQVENVRNLAKNAKEFEEKLLNAAELLKEVKMKAGGLSDSEMRTTTAREKRMRQNVLRVIQRDYQGMSVDDFEDTIYVAIMEYFCNYNVTAVVNRKVLMLEKLVTKLQENYHRTVKQFSEAKHLLKRMVEIRKEELGKCTCQSKIPFKLIRSVAVQVQTTKCRGGDLCPGSDEGISFKSKPPSENINGIKQRRVERIQDPGDTTSTSPSKTGPKLPSPSTTVQKPIGSRPVSVSVPSVRVQPPSIKTPTEIQNGLTKSVSPLSTRRSPAQVVVNNVKPSTSSSPVTPAKPTPPANSSIVIDLTDKDEEVSVQRPVGPTPSPSPSKFVKPSTTVQTPPTVPTTRVVKTSVLSPMPVLPPLPPAPLYKSLVRRPPQPVLKVCKADQSGIMLSWTLRSNMPITNEINFYQVYACQENAGVTREWSTVGDVKALPLPMACTLSQFREGHRYHFVVRAVDKFKVLGEFSHPASILLVSKSGGTANHSVSPATSTSTR